MKRDTILVGALLLVIGAFYLLTIRPGHDWGDDAFMYIHHAKNLVEGVPYADTGYIKNQKTMTPEMYPPIFPLLLAPVYQWQGLDLKAMKIEILLMFLVSLYLAHRLLRRDLPAAYGLAAVALIGFCPYFWDFKDKVLSDLPFLMFAYAALLSLRKSYDEGTAQGRTASWAALAGVLIFLAYGTRTPGLVLIPTLLAYEVIRFRRITVTGLVAGLVFVALTGAQRMVLPMKGSYVRMLLQTVQPREYLSSSYYYLKSLSVLWENGMSPVIRYGWLAFSLPPAGLGFWGRMKKGPGLLEIFSVLYLALICLFPWGGKRYLIPVMPFFLYYVFHGFRNVGVLWGRRAETALAAFFIAGTVVIYGTRFGIANWDFVEKRFDTKETLELFRYVEAHTGTDDVFVMRKPRALSLFTGRPATDLHCAATDRESWDHIRRTNARYLIGSSVIEDEQEVCLKTFIEDNHSKLTKIFSNADFAVYRIPAHSPLD